jgi:acyl-CoA thioester hydrolase
MSGKITPVKIRIRYNECDPSGYAFNANFFVWMQEATSQYFHDVGVDVKELATARQTFMAVHLSCDYMRPVSPGEWIEIKPHLVELGESTIHVQYEIYKGDTLSARGKTIHVFMDTREKKKVPLTDELKAKFEAAR